MKLMKISLFFTLLVCARGLYSQTTDTKIGPGIRVASQYKSLQAAHDALPASGGTIFVPVGTSLDQGLTISKPIHLIFDLGVFTYAGQAEAIRINEGVRGVMIDGSGGAEFNSPVSGSVINVVNPAATGLNALASPS